MWDELVKYSGKIFIFFYLVFMMSGLFIHISFFGFVIKEGRNCLSFFWIIFTPVLLLLSFGGDYFFIPHAGSWWNWFVIPNIAASYKVACFRGMVFTGSVILTILWIFSLPIFFSSNRNE